MKQTALLRFCCGGLIGIAAFTTGFLAYPLEGIVTWFAYIIIGWALLSATVAAGWIGACHLVWWQQSRRSRNISTRASRPVGNQAERALPSRCAPRQVRTRDEGTAPVDRAPVPVPGEKHPPLRLTT